MKGVWFYLLVCDALLVVVFSEPPYKCPLNLVNNLYVKIFRASCYEFVVIREKTFEDAQSYCKQQKGYLATIDSADVNGFLCDTITNSYSSHEGPFLIGLQRYTDGSYEWKDGSPLQYTNFAYNPPSSTEEYAFALNPKAKNWRAIRHFSSLYDLKLNFICEYPAVPITTLPPPITTKFTEDDCPQNLPRNIYLQVFGSKCYTFEIRNKKFDEANGVCGSKGGNLISIDGFREQEFVLGTFRQMFGIKASKPTWLGLEYNVFSKSYKWLDGSSLGYSNFQSGISTHGEKTCVVMSGSQGKWAARSCREDSLPFVCEFELLTKETTTEITTASTVMASLEMMTTSTEVLKNNLQIYGNFRFYFNFQPVTFAEAVTRCRQDEGGSLALVKSRSLGDFLQRRLHFTYDRAYLSDSLWIGLRFNSTAGFFYWLDGSPQSLPDYDLYVQNGACVALTPWSGQWAEVPCGEGRSGIQDKRGFICQV